jgi:hypothetical protein
MAALHLLVARAAAIDVDCLTIISRRDEWKLGKMKPPSPRFPNPRPIAAWQARVVRLRDTDMSQAAAASRLDDIVGLAMDAVKSPRPAFGQVLTAAAAQREAEFERTIGSEFYGRSSEAVFFGASPTFADVFTAVPARLTFLDDVGRLLCPRHDSKSGEYLLA